MATGVLSQLKYKLYGLVFLIVLALLIGLTIAIYNKAFTPVVPIDLRVERAGLQTLPRSDVKIRGLIVGEVSSISTTGDTTTLHLALKPDQVSQIPRNVEARLIPKTLFGEKYVDLVIPGQPAMEPIQAGDVIPEDQSEIAIELNQVWGDLLPLLRTLEPAKLNATLNALATALDGRGDEIGANAVRLERYLRQLNPSLPTLKEDITGLADFAETYDEATPDLLRMLRGLTVTSRTIVEKRQRFDAFLREVTTASGSGRALLEQNEQRLIQVNAVNRPTLELFARYSPQYPCFLKGLARWEPMLARAFGGNQPGLHITLELVKPREAYRYPEDLPRWGDRRGPRCYTLPYPDTPAPFEKFDDGTDDGAADPALIPGLGRPVPSGFAQTSSGYAGSEAEHQLLSYLAGPAMDRRPNQVPDAVDLLLGPMVRGTEVKVR